ncbi:MAG TPA: ankyrin repeat domain-containing protein [Vicinamibacterales bacterium]|nr:ankyrin repeat domain-containing protein [Vicinamibacterales bacterium]
MEVSRIRHLLIGLAVAACLATALEAGSDATVADAARLGDAAAVKALLRNGADVNAAQGDGMTALHWAAQKGDIELVAMLLSAGASVRATTRLGGYTPMHLASQAGHPRVVAALLAAGSPADVRTATGASPLMLAARSGSVDTATRLIENGADINAKESTYGQTALMVAAGLNRAELVALLLARGADAMLASSVVDLNALTAPVDFDPVRGTVEQSGPVATNRPKEVPGLTRPYRYNELIGAQGGLTALHFAARQGATQSVAALVDGGVSVNLPSPGDQATPLLIAIINGHFDIAAYLLDHGADPNRVSDAGVSPLYATLNVQWAPIAAYPQPRAHLQQSRTYLEMMRRLLEKGAEPNQRLKRKVWYSSYNFDQSSVDEIGATPFWRAAYAADVDAMKMLVAAGADPTITTMKPLSRRFPGEGGEDKSGLTPMPIGGPNVTPLQAAAGVGYGFGFAANSHHYAESGMLPAVKYLVDEIGVDVNAVDADGNTAVHHAAARGDNAMILYLVSKGALVTKVNRAGQSTVDMANGPVQRTQPFPETIALLEKLGAVNHHKCVSC